MKGQLLQVESTPKEHRNMENKVCVRSTTNDKRKAAALWKKHKEGDESQG